MQWNERIHIAPVGFEYDRIVKPVEIMGATKLYLVTKEEEDKAEIYVEKIIHYFEDVRSDLEIIVIYCDIYDLIDGGPVSISNKLAVSQYLLFY